MLGERGGLPFHDVFTRLWGKGFFWGLFVCLAIKYVLLPVAALMIVSYALSPSPGESSNVSYAAGMTAFVFAGAFEALVEAAIDESLKAVIVRGCTCCCGAFGLTRWKDGTPAFRGAATMAAFFAVSLGYSFSEYVADILMYKQLALPFARAYQDQSALGMTLLLLGYIGRSAVYTTVFCLCAAFTAMRLTLRDAQLVAQNARRSLDDVQADGAHLAPHASLAGRGQEGEERVLHQEGEEHQVLQQQEQQQQAIRVSQPQQKGGDVPVSSPVPASDPHGGDGRSTGGVTALPPHPVSPTIVVWHWGNVLWPAITIHFTFVCASDYAHMGLDGLDVLSATYGWKYLCMLLCIGIVFAGITSVILAKQSAALQEGVVGGGVPTGVTCSSKMWRLPCFVGAPPPLPPPLSAPTGPSATSVQTNPLRQQLAVPNLKPAASPPSGDPGGPPAVEQPQQLQPELRQQRVDDAEAGREQARKEEEAMIAPDEVAVGVEEWGKLSTYCV